MRHRANPKFWRFYERLSADIQRLADENYTLLKTNSRHPSLHCKKIGRLWSARIGIHYRAVAVEDGSDMVWFWIGHHSEYDQTSQDAFSDLTEAPSLDALGGRQPVRRP